MSLKDSLTDGNSEDTVIVSATSENFTKQFLGENAWHSIRIDRRMLPKIKYIAAYIKLPEGRITHYALVASIKRYGEEGKYKLYFLEAATPIVPIPQGSPSVLIQGHRYTSFQKLITAKKLTDLF